MCGGVYYSLDGEDIRVYFPNPKAQLPVRKKDGEVILLPWGRRKDQAGVLPLAVVLMLGGAWKVSTFFVKDEPTPVPLQTTPAPKVPTERTTAPQPIKPPAPAYSTLWRFAGWVDVGARHYAVLDSKRGSMYQPATTCRGQRDNPRCMFEGQIATLWTGPGPDRSAPPFQTFNAAPSMQTFNSVPDQAGL